MIQHVAVDLDDTLLAQLTPLLCRDGVLTFEGVPDRAALLSLSRRIMSVSHHRDSEQDGITVIHDRGDLVRRRPSYAGFGHDELIVHTEGSALARPPQLMMLYCGRSAGSGGACRLLDGAELHRALAVRYPDLLASLSSPRSVLFGGSAGHLGAVFEEAAGHAVVRFRLDDLVQFSPQITRKLPILRALIAELVVSVNLTPGHGYLLCNTRWLHGREAFTGERLMYRLLGDPLPVLEIAPGFAGTNIIRSAVA
jgi:alpha-ketoglutarate-dependent taurine dioxygenase